MQVLNSNGMGLVVKAETHKEVGDATVGIAVGELMKRGHKVLVPLTQNIRYDLVVDVGNQLMRLQCKTGWLMNNGTVRFHVSSIDRKTKSARHYKGEIDAFLVYCYELDKLYMVPIDHVRGDADMYLRVEPVKNNQFCNVNIAKEFEFL